MTSQIPPKPSLVQLKSQAKDILKAHKRGDASCCDTLRNHHHFAGKTDAGILSSKLVLREAQHALAVSYGFKGWAELRSHVLGETGNAGILHIHCGDTSGDSLRQSSVPGEVLVWHDPVLEGPMQAGLTDREYREMRARFFTENQYTKTYEGALRGLTDRHEQLANARNHAEVVLWFDACLFDQTIMIHIIDKLARTDTGNAGLSLICIGEHPDLERFLGLGQLDSEQMAAVFPTRHEITKPELELATKAWIAFTSDDPHAIEEVLEQDCSALPYLADALIRHLEEYPSVSNGLSQLQREALEVVASGTTNLAHIFTEVSNKEERPFFGDTTLWDCLHQLATAAEPLLTVDGPGPLKHPLWKPIEKVDPWNLGMTETGHDVLAGKADHVKLNGIDRWLGGVHLQGHTPAWRWDEASQGLIS